MSSKPKSASSGDAKKEKKLAAEQAKQKSKEEKRKKQEMKALKKTSKTSKKKSKRNNNNEEDDSDDDRLDELIESFAKRANLDASNDSASSAPIAHVEKVHVSQLRDRARCAFTAVAAPAFSDVVLFGGELFNGAVSRCFDDVLRFAPHPNPKEWKHVTSPAHYCPPPRCAHAAAATPTHMYVFGGEFSTAWRFHHYNDLWRLDLRTNQWKSLQATNGPSPRSGHRMVVWRNYLVVFGGFYEASRGVRWHDDLFFFDLRTEKWLRSKPTTSNAIHPSARSGFLFCAHPTKDVVFLYGGYTKVAAHSSAQKGRAMDDSWILHLTPSKVAGECPEVKWEMCARRGAAPSGKRSGFVCCPHRNRMLVFGGVSDTETANDVEGVFFNSLHAFDMERHRWFELELKRAPGEGGGLSSASAKKAARKRERKAAQLISGSASVASSEMDQDDLFEDDDYNDDGGAGNAMGLNDHAFYVIQDGKFVKVEVEEEAETSMLVEDDEEYAPIPEDKPVKPPQIVEAEDLLMPSAQQQQQQEAAAAAAAAAKEAPAAILPWNGAPAPSPRISAAICVLNNRLLVFGGTYDKGEVQTTFDDVWSLDLNKMDAWVELEAGNWREQAWAGEVGSEDEESESEEEEEEEDSTADDEEFEAALEAEEEEVSNIRRLGDEIKRLRDGLRVDDESVTPQPGETLAVFFNRTAAHWLDQLRFLPVRLRLEGWSESASAMSGKELRRHAFHLARARYEELLPLLEKLNAFEEEQRLAEESVAEEARALEEKEKAREKKKKKLAAKQLKKEKAKAQAEEAEEE